MPLGVWGSICAGRDQAGGILRSWSAQLEQLLVFNFRLMIVVRSCCRLATLLGWEYLLCYGRLWYFKIPEWTKTSAGEKLIAAI